MAESTMEELLRAPTKRYGEAIVLPEINADHFEIKTNLLQLANPFYGRESENPHAHINSFKRITSTLRFRNVPNDVIKLMMFPYSLDGAAKTCMNATSSKTDERIDKLADQLSTLVEIVSNKVVTPAPVKAVEETCVTCGGTRSWYNCPATDNNQASVCATTGTYNQVNPPNRVSNQIAPPGFAPVQNNGQNRFAIRIEFADALLLVPDLLLLQLEFAPRIRKVACIRLRYVEREFARDALKKLSEKSWMIRYKVFLITCNFLGMDVLSRTWPILGQRSINLIASFIWIKDFHLHRSLTQTRMTLELADRSITHPKGVVEDVFVKVRSFHFPTDFVVVDFEVDPRVPLILGRSFLRSTYTGRALLIDPLHYEFAGGFITIPLGIVREHEDYINRMSLQCGNSSSRSPENFHTIIESLPSSINLVEDSDSNREEIDIFSGPDDLIPSGIESDFNSEEDIIDNLHNDDPIPEYERLTFDMEPDVPVINNVNEDECWDVAETNVLHGMISPSNSLFSRVEREA
ncbi:reverse transcriptase domain-containing protein [Tanacetum coccineum]